jgi:DNA polymerase-3 subunit delta
VAELEPVYLLTGSDRPKIARALHRLRARIGEAAIEQLSALDASGADVANACNALGLFVGEARLVLVTDVDGRRTNEGRLTGGWKKADHDAIAAYLASPAPGTVLALVAEELKPDSTLFKACKKAGAVLHYDVPKRNVAAWVADQFRRLGARAEPEACAALVQLVGDDLHTLENEVSKLATWAAGEPIGEAEVEALVAASAELPVFALTDAWGARDARRLLAASETLFDREPRPRRDTAARLAGALGNHVAKVRACQALAAQGIRARDAAPQLKLHPFYAERLFGQAANFSVEELRDAIVRLADLDHALKGGSRLQPDLELQRTLVELGRAEAAPTRRE